MLLSVVSVISFDPPEKENDGTDSALADREIEIIYNLGQDVLQYEDLLAKASDVCGELDRSEVRSFLPDRIADETGSLLALAQGAATYKLARPRMTGENILHIKGGRLVATGATLEICTDAS